MGKDALLLGATITMGNTIASFIQKNINSLSVNLKVEILDQQLRDVPDCKQFPIQSRL